MRNATLVAVAAVVLLVGTALSVDEGEVVTLVTVDDAGHSATTELWIVEVDGQSYLRASSPHARWLDRLRAHPEVEIVRRGERTAARAVPVDDVPVRIAVNWAMREKYGLVDAALVRVIDHSDAVAIRLDPPEPPASGGVSAGAGT